jgi:hypothetical protein
MDAASGRFGFKDLRGGSRLWERDENGGPRPAHGAIGKRAASTSSRENSVAE